MKMDAGVFYKKGRNILRFFNTEQPLHAKHSWSQLCRSHLNVTRPTTNRL